MVLTTSPSTSLQERCGRWLLLLTLLHTLPVLWLTPVAGGTAPAAALLAYGLASLLAFERDSIAVGLFALVPGLLYAALGWVLAWLLARGFIRVPRYLRAVGVTALVGAALAIVYWPIYEAGGHNGSRSASLPELVDNTLSRATLLGYWITLHGVLLMLFVLSLLPDGHTVLRTLEHWRRPIRATAAVLVAGTLLYGYHPLLVCRPLAELGSARAQLCLAEAGGREQRYWYERAAAGGNVAAIAWLIDHTPHRTNRLTLLRQGAGQGDPAIQFALHQHLKRYGGAQTPNETRHWLEQAAHGGHPPAMTALADLLAQGVYQSRSLEVLAERNHWLERAAAAGDRTAIGRLAQHHEDGSMGYPADLAKARAYYLVLADDPSLTANEQALALDAAFYRNRIEQIETWEAGLSQGDPAVVELLSERYLKSQFPGPGVRERGRVLLEQLAEEGDSKARDQLIVSLRTGSGLDKDLNAARRWLIQAAQAGDKAAQRRVVSNYMNGREGFPVDYPEARRWLETFLADLRAQGGEEARIRQLETELAYIDRLEQQAGGPLLDETDLDALGRQADADARYRYALQLLAGHGAARRAEAVSELEAASRLGHGDAAWRLFHIYERGFAAEVNAAAALAQLQHAADNHHFDATRELAMSYEYGKRGLAVDLPRAIALYEAAIAAGHDNRYGWNLDPNHYNHFPWLESRLKQARMKLNARAGR